MLDFISRFFSDREEKISLSEAIDFYRNEKGKEIKAARKEAGDLMETTKEIIESLDAALEELKDYENDKNIQAVDDVADNLYESRKKLINRFDPSYDDIEQHFDEYQEFLEKFNDVSRKEGEVLKFVRSKSGSLPKAIEELTNHKEEIEDFIENDYAVIKHLERLEENIEEINKRKTSLAETKEEVDDLEVESLKEEKKELEQDLKELKSSKEWKEKIEKEDRIENLKQEKDEINSELATQVSIIERPVKKLIYNIENEDLEFDADHQKLESLLEKDFYQIEGLEKTLDEAEDALKNHDIIEDGKKKKFQKAKIELAKLEEKKYLLDEKDDQINRLEQELDEMHVIKEKKDINRELKRLKKEIEQKEDKLEEKKREVDRLTGEIGDLRERIQSNLNEVFEFEVLIE